MVICVCDGKRLKLYNRHKVNRKSYQLFIENQSLKKSSNNIQSIKKQRKRKKEEDKKL